MHDLNRDLLDRPGQPSLFEPEFLEGGAPAERLTPTGSLRVARLWFRRHLEQLGRPRNTVQSYLYDLSILEEEIGLKPLNEITKQDIAHYLGEANTRSTRKRRLTSASGLFKWLVNDIQILDTDPTAEFYPDHIPLKTPRPLLPDQERSFLEAAERDSSRAYLMAKLMLEAGLSRGEILALKRPHLDFSDPKQAWVQVIYDDPRYANKERRLPLGPGYQEAFERFGNDYQPEERLFEMLPQSVNKLVERVAKAAGIPKQVSPQTLRDTYAVNQARAGADESSLLQLLALADEARNRSSVQRYIRVADPNYPMSVENPDRERQETVGQADEIVATDEGV